MRPKLRFPKLLNINPINLESYILKPLISLQRLNISSVALLRPALETQIYQLDSDSARMTWRGKGFWTFEFGVLARKRELFGGEGGLRGTDAVKSMPSTLTATQMNLGEVPWSVA